MSAPAAVAAPASTGHPPAERLARGDVARPGATRRFARLLAAERIKLASTRSPWWCAAIAVVVLVGLAGAEMAFYVPDDGPAWGLMSGFGIVSMPVVVVLATLSVTSEYRFGTIRVTFQAAPNRPVALLAKTVVVTGAAAVIGLVAAFTAWAVARLVAPAADLPLATEAQWRTVAGVAVAYAVAAVLALGVGILLRHGAGALSLLLVWMTLGEGVLAALPRVGSTIARWLPFTNLTRFLTVGVTEPDPARSFFGERLLFGPWPALAYSAGVALAVLAVALLVAQRRDA